MDSEYLTTLIVIVPRNNLEDWLANYETLCEYVVPRSSKKLFEDSEQVLVNVTMFQKVVDTFKMKCRDRKFIVRDFKYDEQAISREQEQIKTLQQNMKDKFGPLVRWLKINFSEAYTAWIHVKALRIFVESVLRYGLPVNFQACVMKPHKKSTKKIRDQLESLFSGLNLESGGHKNNNKQVDALAEVMPGMLGVDNYYSYVFFNLNLDFAESGSKN